jgi:hypothetical protein
MIYKFEDGSTGNIIEVQRHEVAKGLVAISINNENTTDPYNGLSLDLSIEQLYDLIGALHSLQTKIKKGGQNGNR